MNSKPKRLEPSVNNILVGHKEDFKFFENISDSEVWKAFDEGDERAFNYLYRIYTPILYQYGYQLSRNGVLVQDAIQNLFIYIRSRRGNLALVSNIKAYLFKAIQHELFQSFKSEKGFKNFDDFIHPDGFLMEMSPESRFIQQEEDSEQKELITKSLNQLTIKQRHALILLYEEGMSYKEIAEVLDLNQTKSARKLIYRAISALREIIKPTNCY